jgi:hypothetical protein
MRIVQAGELIGNPEVFSTEDIRPMHVSNLALSKQALAIGVN